MEKGENFIRYVSVPLLKDASITRIVTRLWELQCSLENIDFEEEFDCDDEDDDVEDMVYFRSFPGMEKKVLNKLSVLRLPNQLHEEIVRYVRPIGDHLLNWLNPENFRSVGLQKKLCHTRWTNEGAIDLSETIKCLFDSHEEDETMFMTISDACLEDLVKEMWSQLPEHMKDAKSIHNQELCKKYGYDYHFVMYWICFCKDELSSLIGILKKEDNSNVYNCDLSLLENMFGLSLLTHNKLAVKYFWQKLTEAERHKNIIKWIDDLYENDCEYFEREDGYFDIFFFLLGQMDDCEQQRQVFENHGEEILERILFNWPWQKYFLQTISVMFPFLEESTYVELMTKIVSNIRKGRMTEKLFEEVWCASPSNFKTCFLQSVMKLKRFHPNVFHDLLYHGDTDTIKMIVNCASEADKKNFIFRFVRSMYFVNAIANHFVDFDIDDFLRGTLSSESDISECKQMMWMNQMNNDWFDGTDSSEDDEYDSDLGDIFRYMHNNAVAERGDWDEWWYK